MVLYEEIRVGKEACDMQDMYEDSEAMVRSDRGVQGGCDVTSGINSELLPVCNGDRQVDKRLDGNLCILSILLEDDISYVLPNPSELQK